MKLATFLALLLGLNGLAFGQDATPTPIPVATPRPTPTPIPAVFDQSIIDVAMKEVGVTKQVGYESDRVRQYIEETDQELDEYTQDGWCNGFVSWVLKQCGYQFASLNSYSEVDHFFREVDQPRVGDVVIISGHIAFFAGFQKFPGLDDAVLLLGGNQGHRVCVLPISRSMVMKFLEPVKAPSGWMPSHHMVALGMASFNRLDDKSYAMDVLERNARLIGP